MVSIVRNSQQDVSEEMTQMDADPGEIADEGGYDAAFLVMDSEAVSTCDLLCFTLPDSKLCSKISADCD